jgi:hypothetical protein
LFRDVYDLCHSYREFSYIFLYVGRCSAHNIAQHDDTLQAVSGRDPLGPHTSSRMFVYVLQAKDKGLRAVLEEDHYLTALLSQLGGFLIVKLMYSRIF